MVQLRSPRHRPLVGLAQSVWCIDMWLMCMLCVIALEDLSSRLRVLESRVQQSDARLSWLESFVRRFRSAFHALFP